MNLFLTGSLQFGANCLTKKSAFPLYTDIFSFSEIRGGKVNKTGNFVLLEDLLHI